MLAADRRQQILAVLHTTGSARVADLAQRLDVSEMTVHRDLNALAEAGLVEKVHGGARLVTEDVTPAAAPGHCAMCGQPVVARLAVTIHYSDGAQARACCPHCGLMLLNRDQQQIHSALTVDFLFGRVINVAHAFFVIRSRVTTCCAPSVLSFASRADADAFQRGFGGDVFDLNGACADLTAHMCLDPGWIAGGAPEPPADPALHTSPANPERIP